MAFNTAFKIAYFTSYFSMVKSNYGHQVFHIILRGGVVDGKTDNSNVFLSAWNVAWKLGGSVTPLLL